MRLALGAILWGVLASAATTCPVEHCQCGLQKWSCDDSGLRRVPPVEDERVLILSLRRSLVRDLTDDDMTRLGGSVVSLDLSDQRGSTCVMDVRKQTWPAVRVTGLCTVSFL